MSNYFVLDTNIFLHYNYFLEIDWLGILGSRKSTLLIPMSVIKELDEKKHSGLNERIRDRAKKIVKSLYKIFNEGPPYSISTNIDIEFLKSEPDIDWEEEGLAKSSGDDYIIAEILTFIKKNKDSDITFITADLGNILKCKVRDIKTIPISEELKIPILDKDKKEIQELKKELARKKAALPNLQLLFSQTKKNRIQLNIQKPIEINKNHDHIVEEIYNKLKFTRNDITEAIELPNKKLKDLSEDELASVTLNMKHNMERISEEEISRYERELDEYINEYRFYLEEIANHDKICNLIFKLELIMVNNGNIPANDIDVFIHLPDGFTVYRDDSLPIVPNEPKQPVKPRSLSDKISQFTLPDVSLPTFIGPKINLKMGPNIRKTNSYEVRYDREQLKHNMMTILKPIYISYSSFDEVKSFNIDYKILASNYPDKFESKLNIIFKKS